ncbi:MAG: DUF1217 domain-containing protein [Hyphomonadaceae bacterium]|nr:DUF1217 domain-containing protein [Hyphomonadaceae bacterium]
MAITSAVYASLFSSAASAGSVDFSFLAKSSSSTATTANVGSVKSALVNAEKNEAKQLAQVAKDPQIQKDLARYEKVVKNAKSIDDVLNDPVARAVLMTANGLKGDINNIALAKKAMTSDPNNANSVAVKMSSINGAWLDFAKTYNLAQNGLDALSPQNNGAAGRWRLSFDREGENIEAMLEITKVRGGGYQAEVDGVPVPVTIDGNSIKLDLLWRDSADELRTSTFNGTLGKTGLSGTFTNDGETKPATWSAPAYFADAIKGVRDNYIAEKRLDMLDAQMPGLGSAVLFKQSASTFENAIDILGSPLAREVVTTAFNIPKQIAVQSLSAQEKAITQRMNPAKLQNAHFADQIAQRYLIMLNGGLGGVTA